MSSLPDSVAVLRHRDFRLLFGAQAVSVFGDRMVAVALAFAVLSVGGSASSVGLVLAARTLPLVACLLAGGVVADRVSRRAVMVAADLVRFASQGLSAVLLIAGAADVWSLAALAAVTGAATGFFNPASTGLLPAIVPAGQLQQANGLRATAMSVGEILGPMLAGAVVALAGAGWAIALDAATFAGSAAFLARLRVPSAGDRAPASFLGDLRDGWGAFTARTWVWAFVACAALANLGWGAWSSLGPVVADRDLGGAAVWGSVLAAMGVGALIGSVLAVRAEPRRPLVVSGLSGLLMAVPMGMLAAGVPAGALAAVATCAGGSMMLGNSLWESTLQRHVPPESLSRVSSYDWFGSIALTPVGLMLWGPLSDVIGIEASLWAACALVLVAHLAMLAVGDIRRVRAVAAHR
ncbi:MAG: MFS transporter [Solirubrobacteraceae bacterium]